MLSDNVNFTTYCMDIIYDDNFKYSYNIIKDKKYNNLYYSLYNFENSDDAFNSYELLIKLVEEKYDVRIYPFYYEDTDSFYSKIKLGDSWAAFIYDREVNRFSLDSVDKSYNEKAMDELSLYVVYNLIENQKKKQLESRR